MAPPSSTLPMPSFFGCIRTRGLLSGPCALPGRGRGGCQPPPPPGVLKQSSDSDRFNSGARPASSLHTAKPCLWHEWALRPSWTPSLNECLSKQKAFEPPFYIFSLPEKVKPLKEKAPGFMFGLQTKNQAPNGPMATNVIFLPLSGIPPIAVDGRLCFFISRQVQNPWPWVIH